jgi:hypothetical protein
MAELARVAHGTWFSDRRADDRGLRVSVHDPQHLVVLSTWRNDHCVATVQLTMADAGRLAQQLVGALTDAVPVSRTSSPPPRRRERLTAWLRRFRRPSAEVVDLDERR